MKKAIGVLVCLCFVLSAASTVWAQEMQVQTYEKKVLLFTDRVLDGQQFDFVNAKKELIEDIYRTSYIQDFYAKYEAVVRASKSFQFNIEKRLAACKSAEDFQAVKNRQAEWDDFCRMADRAPEDLQKGVIQEYLMDKAREGKPPFEIKSVKWEPVEKTSAQIDAFKKELPKAEKVLSKAIAALKSKKESEFASYFPEKLQLLRKAEPEYSDINKLYKIELQDNWKKGMNTELAPIFVRADLDEAAQLYQNDQVVKTIVRRWQGEEANLCTVLLQKEDKNYVIKEWANGSIDMKNRRR